MKQFLPLIILPVSFVSVLILLTWKYQTPSPQLQKTSALLPPIVLPTGTPDPVDDPTNRTVYLIKILHPSNPEISNNNFALRDEIKATLALPWFVVYSLKSSPENSYYLLTIKNSLVPSKTYQNMDSSIQVVSENQSLSKYLLDSHYCQVDSDCQVSNGGCSVGAFNKYNLEFAGGCGGTSDEEYYLQTGKYFDIDNQKDPDLNCYVNVTYTGAKCLDSICRATGRKPTCKNPQPL